MTLEILLLEMICEAADEAIDQAVQTDQFRLSDRLYEYYCELDEYLIFANEREEW